MSDVNRRMLLTNRPSDRVSLDDFTVDEAAVPEPGPGEALIKVLYVSGTSDGAIARHQMLEPGIEFLEKPFSLDSLLRKVRQVLGADLPAEDATAWTQRSLV